VEKQQLEVRRKYTNEAEWDWSDPAVVEGVYDYCGTRRGYEQGRPTSQGAGALQLQLDWWNRGDRMLRPVCLLHASGRQNVCALVPNVANLLPVDGPDPQRLVFSIGSE
jgi:hypothetical protein